ncbi:MAG TPA: transcriptional regulator NrdR [Chloroflexota bacterium]|nr:transcriptional regulator NrdR [Chloroflexota bacterium]
MKCPHCGFTGGAGQPDSKVLDSRDSENGEATRRRRECLNCHQRYTTYERVERIGLMVVKKDGRREEYSRAKLLGGVATACHRRPIPAGAVEALVDEVESDLFGRGTAEVSTHMIGEMVMDRLRALDEIAYIRFASVYRDFKTLEDLRAAMEGMA